MKFDIVSDLHTDTWDTEQQVQWENVKKSDTIIIAGDIADNLDHTIVEIKRISEIYKTVLYIDGNHEHVHTWPNFQGAINHIKENTKNIPNFIFLHKKYHIIDDIAFVGACGWWDFKFSNPTDEDICREMFTKAKGFDICDKIIEQSHEDAKWIKYAVKELNDNPSINEIVVITHTAPNQKLISWSVYPPDTRMSGCYGNPLMEDVLNYNTNKKIKRWISGHNHDARNVMIGGINYLSNPRGRPRDFNRIDYRPLTIEAIHLL